VSVALLFSYIRVDFTHGSHTWDASLLVHQFCEIIPSYVDGNEWD